MMVSSIAKKQFYNYIYLDPRKPGKYEYSGLDFCFLYEPFYVGKGSGYRWRLHVTKSLLKINTPKSAKIKKILKTHNPLDYVLIFNKDSESIAIQEEIYLIAIIKRKDENGPLTNLTAGGDGVSGFKHSDISKLRFKEICKNRDPLVYKKIADKNRGRKQLQEHVDSRARANTGKRRSDELKARMLNIMKQFNFIAISPNNKIFENIYNINLFLKQNNISSNLASLNFNRHPDNIVNTLTGWIVIRIKIDNTTFNLQTFLKDHNIDLANRVINSRSKSNKFNSRYIYSAISPDNIEYLNIENFDAFVKSNKIMKSARAINFGRVGNTYKTKSGWIVNREPK